MLVANFAGLENHMANNQYVVTVGNTAIGLDEIHDPIGKQEILITPVITGAGGNTGRTILGIALIATAIVMSGGTAAPLAAAKGLAAATTFSSSAAFIFKAGVLLTLSGIAGLLTPTPKTPEQTEDPRESFNFSGITNTSAAGVPVPIVLGRTITGSVVVSAGIDTVQVDT